MTIQLYLHFPFCKRKCFYCDFCSAVATDAEITAYCDAMKKEIRLWAARYPHAVVSTVFLGGGTPSVVPARDLDGVLRELRASFAFAPQAEFTAEANPGALSERWLDAAQAHGLNRLSLGVQAAQNRLLKRIGRIHTFPEAVEAVHLARRRGIRNLSADLMFGLPSQTPGDYLDSIDALCELGPEHLSAYSLILEQGTPLDAAVARGEEALPDEDETADMYEQGIARLAARGYAQYEVSNFAREGFRCRHNVGYWQGAYYLGIGVAAHGMLPPNGSRALFGVAHIRHANLPDRKAYVDALSRGEWPPASEEKIGAREAMFETMMLGLRMTDGVSAAEFLSRHGQTLQSAYGPALAGLVGDGLARWLPGERFALTPRGLMLQNDALLRLMK